MKIKNPERLCYVSERHNQLVLTMPDGTVIPEQITLTLIQNLEEPIFAEAEILVRVKTSLYLTWKAFGGVSEIADQSIAGADAFFDQQKA